MAGNPTQMKKAGAGAGAGAGGAPAKAKDDALKEEQLEKALKHLDLLHVKCRQLRTTIPRMIETIPDNQPRDVIFKMFSSTVQSSQTEISDFTALYRGEESKKVLDQAKKSRDANPKGIRPWRAKDHPDWLDSGEKP
ncbi:hypothetical protein F4809DRAFT_596847 [Biscogniauxia mediterranea]|nr:hypothetical protein F4809DRAFT_596847 [Biscogniauxia mediterranea]